MPVINHTHTYKRLGTRKSKIYICADPDCSHREVKSHINGKSSLCNNCHEKFILTSYNIKMAKPLCMNCSNTKEAKDFRKKREALEGIGIL